MVTVVFTRRRNLGSLALRTFLWSDWSHCGILHDGRVVEASAYGVVRIRTLDEFLHGVSRSKVVSLPGDSAAVFFAAATQEGKKYDWLGCLGIATRRKLESKDRWFCSELVAWAFKQAGYPLFSIKPWRITPRDLYMIGR